MLMFVLIICYFYVDSIIVVIINVKHIICETKKNNVFILYYFIFLKHVT